MVQVDVNEILASLDSGLKRKLFVGDQIPEYEYIPTPSATLNRALGGGIIQGRQTLIFGSKSSGKSTLCLGMAANAQRMGKTVAWVDAESSYDPKWAERLGVDNANIIVSKAQTVNDMVDVVTQLMRAGIDLVIVDSISSLLPAIYFDKSDNLKQLEDTKQIGAEARDMANAVKMMNYANNNTALVLISQVRTGIHATYTEMIPTGGQATLFYSSTIVKLNSPKSQAIKGKVKVGDKLIEKIVGRNVDWLITYNKTAEAFTAGSYPLIFVGNNVGVDNITEVVDMAIESGAVEKRGAWLYHGEDQWNGRDKLAEHLRNDPELLKKLESSSV